MRKIIIIAAMTPSGVIGKSGKLPWHLKSELAHFKRITMGRPVIMGRKTFESLGGKDLPGREIIVVSRQSLSLKQALIQTQNAPEVLILGGSEIYAQCLALATHMILSVLDQEYAGDTFFPKYDLSRWHLEKQEQHEGFRVQYYSAAKSNS